MVGAGVTGLLTAIHLAGQGARTAVLEAREPGFGGAVEAEAALLNAAQTERSPRNRPCPSPPVKPLPFHDPVARFARLHMPHLRRLGRTD